MNEQQTKQGIVNALKDFGTRPLAESFHGTHGMTAERCLSACADLPARTRKQVVWMAFPSQKTPNPACEILLHFSI